MEYHKPKMICFDEVMIGIQGTKFKPDARVVDALGVRYHTIAAYELDE